MGFLEEIEEEKRNNLSAVSNPSNPAFRPSAGDSNRVRQMKADLAQQSEARKKRYEEQNRNATEQQSIVQAGRDQLTNTEHVQSGSDFAQNGLGTRDEDLQNSLAQNSMTKSDADYLQTAKNNENSEFDVDKIYQGATTKFYDNFMVGLGGIIGDFGDIIQMASGALGISDLTEGNFLSKALQDAGHGMQKDNATYIPPELQGDNFSVKSLLNPDFWLIHGAQFTPIILELLATAGAGAAVERGVVGGIEKTLGKVYAKELAEKGVLRGAEEAAGGVAMHMGEAATKQVGKSAVERGLVGTTVNTTGLGVGTISENTAGRGIAGLLRDTGRVSNSGKLVGQIANNVSAGALMNIRMSASTAGHTYNTYADMKKEDGTPMFSKEELAQIASGTFGNSMKWMMMDIASWSLTYGGLKGVLSEGLENITRKVLPTAAQREVSGALVSKVVSSPLKNALSIIGSQAAKMGDRGVKLARFATPMAIEGIEKSVMMVHQQWSAMKAFEEATGSLASWEGEGNPKDRNSFYDYYMSKELAETRFVGGVLSAVSGGLSNIKELVNKHAEDGHKLNTRADYLKDVLKSGTKDKEIQQFQVSSTIAEMVFQGGEHQSEGFLNTMLDRGIIDEARADQLRSIRDEALVNREKTNLLNIEGKKAYFTSLMQVREYSGLREAAVDRANVQMGQLEEQYSNMTPEEKLADKDYLKVKEKIEHDKNISIMSSEQMVDTAQHNIKNLLVGKPADPIKLGKGVYHNGAYSGESPGADFYYNSYKEKDKTNFDTEDGSDPVDSNGKRIFTDKDDAVAKAKAIQDVKDIGNGIVKGVEKGKELFKKGKEKAKEFKDSPFLKKVKDKIEKTKESIDTAIENQKTKAQEKKVADENSTPETKADAYVEKDLIAPSKPISELTHEEVFERMDHLDEVTESINNNPVQSVKSKENLAKIESEFSELTKHLEGLSEKSKPEEVPASVKVMITNADRKALKDLGYTPKDIKAMKPEEAGKILDDKLSKGTKKTESGIKFESSGDDVLDNMVDNYTREKRTQSDDTKIENQVEQEGISDILFDDAKESRPKGAKNKKTLKNEENHRNELLNRKEELAERQKFLDEAKKDVEAKTEKYKEDPNEINKKSLDEAKQELFNSEKEIYDFNAETESIAKEDPNKRYAKDEVISKPGDFVLLPEEKEASKKSEVEEEKKPLGEKVAETIATAVVGTKKGLNNFQKIGRAFGGKVAKMSGRYGKRQYYNQRMINSEEFSHQFMMRQNEINNSGLWNGKEKPNLIYVHNLNQLSRGRISETSEGFFIPLTNTIIMKQAHWNDAKTYHHEFLHFNYAYMANSNEMKNYLDAMTNKAPKLLNKISRMYDDKKIVEVPIHVAENWSKRKIFNEKEKLIKQGLTEAEAKDAMALDFVQVTKGQLERTYKQMTPAQYDNYLKEGTFKELPLREQSTIMEEFFVATQQGERSKKYNMYFDKNPEMSARMAYWKDLKSRWKNVFKSDEQLNNSKLEALDVENFKEFTDVDSALWSDFSERYPAGSLDIEIREKRIDFAKEEYAERQGEIEKEITLLNEENKKGPKTKNQFEEEVSEIKTETSEDRNYENVEGGKSLASEDWENLSINQMADTFDQNKASERAIQKKIDNALSYVNTRQKFSWIEAMKRNNDERVEPVLLDKIALNQEMFERAKDSSSLTDFVMQMENSNVPEVQIFMRAVSKGKGQDSSLSILKSFYTLNRNQHNVLPIMLVLDKSGKLNIEDAKTSMAKAKLGTLRESFKNRASKSSNRSQVNPRAFSEFAENMEKIRTTPIADIDPKTIRRVLEYFGDRSMDYDRIIANNSIVYEGNRYPLIPLLKDIAVNAAKGKYILNEKGTKYIPFDPSIHENKNIYGYNSKSDAIDRRRNKNIPFGVNRQNVIYDNFIKALLGTDMQYKNSKVYRDANGNLTGTRIQHNGLLGTFESMSNHILNNLDTENPLSKRQFIAKYSNIAAAQYGKGKYSNALLGHIFDTVKRTQAPYEVKTSFGIRNDKNSEGKAFKELTSDEASIADLSFFNNAFARGKKEYVMDLGRFSSSSRQYLINVPIYDGMFNKSTMMLNKTAENIALFNIHKNQANTGPEYTFESYSKDLKDLVNNEISYWEKKRIEIDPELRESTQMLKTGKEGVLTDSIPFTEAQKRDIASYVYNQNANGLFSNEILLPTFKFEKNDTIKRSSSMSTNYVPLGDNVKHEILYFKDRSEGSKDTDGSAYILPEDFNKISNMAGDAMPSNGQLKMTHVGIEQGGPEGMSGTNQHDKALYISLTDSFVKQNPALEPLRDSMRSRKQKWTDTTGKEQSSDFADGRENHLITAVSMSAEKTKSRVKENWALNLSDINSKESHAKLDNIYYKEGSFKGFSGENMGQQIVMNNNVNHSVVASQLLSFITTGGNTYGDFGKLQEIQSHIYDTMQDNISGLKDIIAKGNVTDLTNFIRENKFFNEEKMDPLTRDILFSENLDANMPKAKQLVVDTIKQYIIKNGNRLSTDGTQARVIPSFSFEKSFVIDGKRYAIEELENVRNKDANNSEYIGYQSSGSGIRNYRKTLKKVDGKWEESYEPAEIVAPLNLKKQGVRSRQYFVAWDGKLDMNSKAYRKAVSYAESVGLKSSDLKRFQIKGNGEVADHGGFYVPGETIMGTRIPSHGPQSTGFFEVIDFDSTGTSQAQVGKEFTRVTGQDFDGDALYINTRSGGENWKQAFDKMKEHWLSPDMQRNLVNEELSFETKAKEANKVLDELLPDSKSNNLSNFMHTPAGRRMQFENTLISKNNIGSVMSMHRTYSILSDYKVGFREPIHIGDKYLFEGFGENDTNGIGDSRTILSGNIANLVLDDVSNNLASRLGIDANNLKYVMPLINMGVSLGDVALIMNSDIMKRWNSLNKEKNNVFSENSYLNNDISSRENMKILFNNEDVSGARSHIDLETVNGINSTESKKGIVKLISQLSEIQNDIQKINIITKGHNEMESNAFINENQVKTFDKFLKGEEKDSFLLSNDDLRKSPLYKNYIDNMKLLSDVSKKVDIVYTDKGKKMFETLTTDNPRRISVEKQKQLHSAAEKFVIAQNLGLSGPKVKAHVKALFDPKNKEKNIYKRLDDYMSLPFAESERNVLNGKTKANSSFLFRDVLLTNLSGKDEYKYIRLNSAIANEDIHSNSLAYAKSEFSKLDTDLQRDLIIYDLVKNGFNDKGSLSSLFSQEQKSQIQHAINEGMKNPDPAFNYSEFANNFMGNNASDFALTTKNYISTDKDGNLGINKNEGMKLVNKRFVKSIEAALKNDKQVYFRDQTLTNGKVTSENLYRIKPFSEAEIIEFNKVQRGTLDVKKDLGYNIENNFSASDVFLINKMASKLVKVKFDSEIPEVGQVIGTNREASKRNNGVNLFDSLDVLEKRADGENFYRYEEKMERGDFERAMDFPLNFDETIKAGLYNEYRNEYNKAEVLNNNYPEAKIKSMSDKDLMDFYENKETGIGYKNKYAYAKILGKVSREIASRSALEQGNLIREKNPGINYMDPKKSKDIGTIQAWLGASNIPSDHPDLQHAIRVLKSDEKIFKREKAEYMKRLNKVTGDLYKEKLGFDPYDGLVGKFQYAKNEITHYLKKDDVLNQLYGNMVVNEIITKDNGATIKNMRFHDKEVMDAKLDKGEITQVEHNFFTETSNMMKEFAPGMDLKRGERRGYIPHIAPTIMESFARKGLLGVMVNLKSADEQIGDVKLFYNKKLMSYEDVRANYINEYNSPEYIKNRSKDSAIELYKLKTKAIKLLKEGKNEDGSNISYSNIGMGSVIGDTFMNKFTGKRGVEASDLPSMDLNKAFSEYIHSALFANGNENFAGFKDRLPLIDGIIARAYKGNQPNTVKYVERVWRDYFLKGAKQHHLPNSAHLESLNITTDKAIDFITRGSLFYWLGYKGLVAGKGLYAVGNVLAGKYNNIKDRGGKEWIQGEKRFWLGNGKATLTDPFGGLKESLRIMKKAGFMDINVYDDLPLSKTNSVGSFLGDVALLPMVWSEKWIQGVQFLGNLKKEEYYSLAKDENYKIPDERMNEIESNVTLSQGRGYQATDQRMIQMYSYGRMASQFSRWIPTTYYNLFGKKDFDIYGDVHVGSYVAAYQHYGKIISRFVTGEITPAEYAKYRNSLTDAEKKRIDSAWRGFGLMGIATMGAIAGFNPSNKLIADANIFLDANKLSKKMIPPAASMTMNLMGY